MKNVDYIEGLVSIVIPTYKRSEMLIRAIDSVLTQTYRKIELIVVNDNEIGDEYSQQLYEILSYYKDERLMLVEQPRHINGAVARNAGIKKSMGEYIAFLDDDDWWESNKLELQVRLLSSLDSSWGGVSCLKQYHNKNGVYRASRPYKDGDVFNEVICFMTNITTGTILMRRKALDKTGYFDEKLKRQQDVQLFAYFTSKYKVKLLNKYLLNIDLSDGQNRVSSNKIDEIKEAYISSVYPLISNKERLKRNLYLHNKFTKGIFLIRDKKMRGTLLILSTLRCPNVFIREVAYYYSNWKEIVFCDEYLSKYK